MTAQLRNFIDASKRLVVLTGAGCSTESGIPDYRSPGGAWTRQLKLNVVNEQAGIAKSGPGIPGQGLGFTHRQARRWGRLLRRRKDRHPRVGMSELQRPGEVLDVARASRAVRGSSPKRHSINFNIEV